MHSIGRQRAQDRGTALGDSGHTGPPRRHSEQHGGKDHVTEVDPWEGLAPPTLLDGSRVKGKAAGKLRLENRRRRKAAQAEQQPRDYWTKHCRTFSVPTPKASPHKYVGRMCPQGLALEHPAAATLLKYATQGCPAETGAPWSRSDMEEAIARGPHSSALEPDPMAYLQEEVRQKVLDKQAKLVPWDSIKNNPPRELKISPIAAIPHKSCAFRAIVDLSFGLRLSDGGILAAVNDTTTRTAPKGAIDQLGHSLSRVIHAFAQAADDEKIFMAKWDVAVGFWRLVGRLGDEWNFAYVLPQEEGQPVQLVVPTSLQMGWVESPAYFCSAAETARDVALDYIETSIGDLPQHKFQSETEARQEFQALPETRRSNDLRYVVEVFVDDFMSLAIGTSKETLQHVSTAIMKGIHDVFPAEEDPTKDPISFKKIKKGEGHWALEKELLGFDFDGVAHTIWLSAAKREALLLVLKGWLRTARRSQGDIPFKEFESIAQKCRHAFTAHPAGKGLLSPLNDVIRAQPPVVFLHRNKPLYTAIEDIRTLIKETMSGPTHCAQLVKGWPHYIGVKDASGHGVGGIIVGECAECIPTVFRLRWPPDIRAEIVSDTNPRGKITNSDLEMAGLLLLWLVMEQVCPNLQRKHVTLFSDNSPTVAWVQRMASKSSPIAQQLLRALGLRLAKCKACPLTTLHIAGVQNAMTDIPSRSWSSEKKWHCTSDDDLLTLFNASFPLPGQNSWSVFQVGNAAATKVISVLRTKPFTLAEWRRLKKDGRHGLVCLRRASGSGPCPAGHPAPHQNTMPHQICSASSFGLVR